MRSHGHDLMKSAGGSGIPGWSGEGEQEQWCETGSIECTSSITYM